jgi:hypothetical protein
MLKATGHTGVTAGAATDEAAGATGLGLFGRLLAVWPAVFVVSDKRLSEAAISVNEIILFITWLLKFHGMVTYALHHRSTIPLTIIDTLRMNN